MPNIEMRFNKDMLVVEGGMATMFARYGMSDVDAPELLNITEPQLIEEIHRYYQLAGAQCAITNSYGASRTLLERAGLGDDLQHVNAAAVRLAKSVNPQHVLADVGPCAVRVVDDETRQEARRQYAEQVHALAAEGPDAILLEAFDCIDDAACAVEAAVETCELPVICTCMLNDQGAMVGCGTAMELAMQTLENAGASVVGMGCSLTARQMAQLAPRLRACTTLPLMAMPDVAIPQRMPNGELQYDGSPDAMAVAALQMHAAGVQMLGSCCGSTPAYTGAIFASIGGLSVAVQQPSDTAVTLSSGASVNIVANM